MDSREKILLKIFNDCIKQNNDYRKYIKRKL